MINKIYSTLLLLGLDSQQGNLSYKIQSVLNRLMRIQQINSIAKMFNRVKLMIFQIFPSDLKAWELELQFK